MPSPVISENIVLSLMEWFRIHARQFPWRGETDPYRIWVSEVMLQQTQASTVRFYYENWMKSFPDLESLARADEQQVLKAWEGLGYYSRARNLLESARHVHDHLEGRMPDDYESLMKLKGIGPYIASAVVSIAFNRPVGVADGNAIRAVSRLFCLRENSTTQAFRRRIQSVIETGFQSLEPRWVNQAWMEFGALQCIPRPKCPLCPLKQSCKALEAGLVRSIPVKPPGVPVPTRTGAAFIIQTGTRILMVRRHNSGLLGGLWELPNVMLDECAVGAFACRIGIYGISPLDIRIHHRYTHFKLILDLYRARLTGAWRHPGWCKAAWIAPDRLNRLPKSGVHIKALTAAGLLDDPSG